MKLTVVGCSGSIPGPDSAASCYLVEVPLTSGASAGAAASARTFRVLLDLGNGSLGSLAQYIDIYSIDAVLLSHLHADHMMDLCSYYVARKYGPSGPLPAVDVYGPAGTADRLSAAYGLPANPGMRTEFNFGAYPQPGTGSALHLGPLRITTAVMAHPVACYALRLEAHGRVLVYSGDTGPTTALSDLARGADLLLAEATFVEGVAEPPDLHMTGRQAALAAKAAGVGRLVLTHVPPWHSREVAVAEAREVFDGVVVAAKPGQVHDV